MPHLHIEYSKGINDPVIASLCEAVHKVMFTDSLFPDAGIVEQPKSYMRQVTKYLKQHKRCLVSHYLQRILRCR